MTTPDYDTDFCAWTQRHAAAIRAKDLAALDIDHLAEEVEDLGRSVRRGITSPLDRLLLHLMKWGYDPSPESRARGGIGRLRSACSGRHPIIITFPPMGNEADLIVITIS